MAQRWVITGGAGFIGCNLIRWLLQARPEVEIWNLDALTYAGNLSNCADYARHPRYHFVEGNICDHRLLESLLPGKDAVLHLAAETHVDRSILDAHAFIATNLEGTQSLLDASRLAGVRRFLYVSTDEVYGSLGPAGRFTESSPLLPSSPYAASKAGGEHLALAAYRTHGLPVIVTRCSNNYGPFQHPEKFIPLMITNALARQPIPIYGDGRQVRNWIHVDDHGRGLLAALDMAQPGAIYNLSSDDELDNLTLARRLLEMIGAPASLIQHVADRPGHDFRYALDSSRARRELNWRPAIPLLDGLRETAAWYRSHGDWVTGARGRKFNEWYARQYSARLS